MGLRGEGISLRRGIERTAFRDAIQLISAGQSAGAKILLDTYESQAEQWCWRVQWHVHYESIWTLFWKFALLNHITTRELAQLVISRACGRRTTICAKPDVDLRDASVFDLSLLAQLFRVSPPKMRRAFLFETLPGSALRSREHLRWCAQCMSRGFHSPLFQMRLTQSCPIHDQPLKEHCQSCLRPIPYRLNAAFLAKPFHCPHCDSSLAPAMHVERPEVMRLRQDHIIRFALLHKFHRSAIADLISVRDADQLFSSARDAGISYINLDELGIEGHYASFITQVLEDVSAGGHRRQAGLCFEPIGRHECGAWRPIDDGDVHDVESKEDDREAQRTLTESELCLNGLHDTYKAIRRHLWRRLLKKHRRCIHSAASRMWWNVTGECTSTFCPHAVAFIRWRMLWESCGTPRYLFAPPAKEYFGIIGWHLARPSPAPVHWTVATKTWISRRIFASSCLASFAEMEGWARATCHAEAITWERPKSAVSYTCLWAVTGRDSRAMPAKVYIQIPPVAAEGNHTIGFGSDHWAKHQAQIAKIYR